MFWGLKEDNTEIYEQSRQSVKVSSSYLGRDSGYLDLKLYCENLQVITLSQVSQAKSVDDKSTCQRFLCRLNEIIHENLNQRLASKNSMNVSHYHYQNAPKEKRK